MARRFKQTRTLLFLLGLVLLWIALPRAFKAHARDAFFEFQAPSWVAVSYLGDLQNYWSLRTRSKNELIEAGRDLARLNAAYEISIQENRALKQEVERMERILAMPREPGFRYEVARVIQRDLNSWWQRVTVRKGARDGLEVGQAVVFAGGVAGRVEEVHTYTAVVELITSPTFRMAAHFEGDNRPVTFQGGLSSVLTAPHGTVRNAPLDLTPSTDRPLRLVSSRLGGIFPDGLTIGLVRELKTGQDGLFQAGEVALDQRLLELREVAILIPENYGNQERR